MFLASTAIEQFWNKNEELLFLGRWCVRRLSPNELKQLRYTVLPNPWNDRRRLSEVESYLDRFSETALNQLSEYLNQTHGVHLDTRYWRVLVSPWLVHYLHVLYDRYTILSDAFAKYPDLQTVVLDPECFYRPPDTGSFAKASMEDPYNLQLFSALLGAMEHDFQTQPYHPIVTGAQPDRNTLRVRLKKAVLRAESVAKTIAIKRGDGVGMYSMYWKRPQQWTLALHSGFKFFPFSLTTSPLARAGSHRDPQRRHAIGSLPASSPFEKIFWRLAEDDFPEIYLEGYEYAREAVLSSNPRFPEAVLADSAWYFDEPFKFFAAEAHRSGKCLVAAQHGGGFGLTRYIPSELHESRLADAYFVWGWADSQPKHHNLPSPCIGRDRRPSKNHSSILFISTANPLYLCYRFHSTPLGDQWIDYFEWQLRFLKELSTSYRRSTIYRPYPIENGFDITAQVQEKFPEVRIDRGRLPHELSRSRLVVIDHSGTTFLQTLASNIPTILYWDPQRWEIRDEAMPYMELLVKAGILWPTPEDAARAVERVYDNVTDWWDGREIQNARRTFCSRFALSSENWVQAWKKQLATCKMGFAIRN